MLPLAVLLLASPASPARDAANDAAPNLWGQTGVVRLDSARAPGNLRFDVGAQGFLALNSDYLIAGSENALVGGSLSASAAFLDVFEVAVATRGASNANDQVAAAAFSLGDVYPSFKLGFTFLPVAVGLGVRGRIPTAVDAAGLDLANAGVTTQGLVTLDLKEGMDIPVRVHLNGGYIYENGKYAQGDGGQFEDNPNFYVGVDGAFLALASDNWFYDSFVGGLGVEAPLPFVTPFLEVFYRAAFGVPDGRGANGGVYDFGADAHLTVTPGVRITALDGFTVDLGADIGLLGTADAGTDATKLVAGTPPNPPYLLRMGITSTFDPFAAPSSSGSVVAAGPAGTIKGCVVDVNNAPVAGAVIDGPALGGALLATDAKGCFVTPPLAVGAVELAIAKPGYESASVSANIEDGKAAEVSATLKGGGGGGSGTAIAPASGGARVVGYVTNKEDETLEADIEVWDSSGNRPAGKSTGGAFDVAVQSGEVSVVARADGYLAQGATLRVSPSERGRVAIELKKTPKKRQASLEKDRIATTAKVPFEFKKPRLQSTAEYVLDDIVDLMLRNPTVKVRVEVHSEPLATPEESQRLADERGAAVIDYLVQRGVWRARLAAQGTPLPPNEADKGRRVDFLLQ